MTLDETLEKLVKLKLHTMATALREIAASSPRHALSFEEKLGMMVDRELSERDNRKLDRRIKEAKLPLSASPEDVACDATRGIERANLRQLATCDWVKAKQNVLITGRTGVGKSHLAAALAKAACRRGFRAHYSRVSRLLQELAVARADGSYASLLIKISRVDVLVLDDFLIAPLKDSERRDLLEILEDRYDHSSTIVTSQRDNKTWHEALGEPTVADAICDRLVHNAHVINLTGPSIRKNKGLTAETKTSKN